MNMEKNEDGTENGDIGITEDNGAGGEEQGPCPLPRPRGCVGCVACRTRSVSSLVRDG